LFNFPAKPFVGTYVDWKTHCLKTAFLSNSYAACRVSALLELGLFPEDVIFGEDMYVAVWVLQVGYNMVYAADACVYHSHYPRNRSWTGWSVRFSGCRARHNDAD